MSDFIRTTKPLPAKVEMPCADLAICLPHELKDKEEKELLANIVKALGHNIQDVAIYNFVQTERMNTEVQAKNIIAFSNSPKTKGYSEDTNYGQCFFTYALEALILYPQLKKETWQQLQQLRTKV